ncbi:biotin-dependent carboxyltransferase family protein [Ornithinibacillus scapharcae]|uniref:5-oxoprolinase subunit C family protein n=1 Tax=Ornithinibacillus scapharcae TaxID=1147159 RepID=UPI000225B41C|nr:biotin-dependent carboxyltransferase family protein [Ornithinibacillus scapharcae]
MMTTIFEVIKGGLHTTFQDLGRGGFQRFGVPVSGAMDSYSMQLANILVGNNRNEACLEACLIGPTLVAREPISLAITGADFDPKVNGKSVPMWTTLNMKKGDILSFGKWREGVYAYIAVAGGLKATSYFHSKAVDERIGLGKTVETGDIIKGQPKLLKDRLTFHPSIIPSYPTEIQVAIVKGPHLDVIPSNYRKAFFEKTFTLEPNSNRMGYRLHSDDIYLKEITSIWSDAVPHGGIQILPNGQPIILMADRQTTGGYPRIGTVATTDISNVAQLVPRGKLRFYWITIEEAQKRYRKRESILKKLSYFRKQLK